MPPPFPFVVGSPRSGTTLLRAMLSGHSRLAIPPESHFIPIFLDKGMGTEFDYDRFVRLLEGNARFARWDLPIVRPSPEPSSLADALRALYGAYAARVGKDRYGDKTPRYALHAPAIAELLPEAVFVHLIRDGRDVACSLLEVSWGPDTPEDAAEYWWERVSAAREAGRRLPGARYLEIRYEDLVRSPEPALLEICRLIDLELEPTMLDHRARAAAIAASTTDPTAHATLGDSLRHARDWRFELSDEQVSRFESVARAGLAELGYPLHDE